MTNRTASYPQGDPHTMWITPEARTALSALLTDASATDTTAKA